MLHRREVLSTKDAAGKNAKFQAKVWKEGDRSVKRDDCDPPSFEENLERGIVY